MAYHYDSRYTYRPSHESSLRTSRDTDAYSRRAQPPQPAMRASYSEYGSSSSYQSRPYYDYHEPRYAARPDSRVLPQDIPHKSRWPPSPSVEEERTSLAREVSSAGSGAEDDAGEAKSRGTVDQYPIIEEIEQPANAERRFVLVSDPSEDEGSQDAARERRRKSVAERGNMPHLKTDIDDPPLFTKRTSTPYAYTNPQKESLAPSAGEYFLSPETIKPSPSSLPRPVPNNRDANQNAKPAKQLPVRPKHTSSSRPPSPSKNREDVFEDSDADSDTSHLRTARRPARYSFVKSDLQKDDLRANVLDSQAKSERRKRESFSKTEARRDAYIAGGSGSYSSSGSSKQRTPVDSPRSSSSSLNGETRKPRPAPVDAGYTRGSKYASSRPNSPRWNEDPSPPRSPRLPPRRPPSPATSRPSSRSGRPPSPLPSSYAQAQQSPRVPITEADWHATYPPTTDRSRPTTRPERYDTMPVPMPQINVKSPSPARQRQAGNPLPYPVDDRPVDAFMPPEEHYQHDHSYDSYTPITSSPRPTRLDSPVVGAPRERPSAFRPQVSSRQNTTDEIPRSPRVRSNSVRSQFSDDGGRRERKTNVPLSLDRPLPSCSRTGPSSKYNDWYTLEGCSAFDVCPSCYEGVFADTPFARYFSQTRRYERPVARFCDFGSDPWMRLAWLLTIKQRRQAPDLLYNLAKISERERDCPGDRELSTDHITWYGISDPRDGIHVTNFAICPRDLRMVEELFPSMKGYFTRIPATNNPYAILPTYTCSLRVKSGRFPKYLDLLVELDAEARALNQHPHIHRFVQLARENAFKSECQRDKPLVHKAWHFIPALPELTVCQECFDELIWPHLVPSSTSPSAPSTIPKLFNRTIQPVPGEDPELGSSCGLYSPRMRQVWERAVREEDFGYLERKALERKRAEMKFGRERRKILEWMDGLGRGSWEWERAKEELRENEEAWRAWE